MTMFLIFSMLFILKYLTAFEVLVNSRFSTFLTYPVVRPVKLVSRDTFKVSFPRPASNLSLGWKVFVPINPLTTVS